ncbi:MFS transporter [bacterium]|nr:MFS transporter [bacterium]
MRGVYASRLLKNNHAIRSLTLSDFGVWSGSNLIGVVFPLFVIGQIQGATVTDAGISTMIYLGIAALCNIPLGRFMDKHVGLKDELTLLAISNLVRGISLIALALTTSLYWLFILQAVLGIAKSMNTTSWRILFSRFLDKNNIGRSWGAYDTVMSIGFGIAAFLGGYLGENLGYNIVIFIGGIMSLISTFFPLMSFKDIEGVQ